MFDPDTGPAIFLATGQRLASRRSALGDSSAGSPRSELRGERRHRLLGPLEAYLPGLDPVLAGGPATAVRSRLYASR